MSFGDSKGGSLKRHFGDKDAVIPAWDSDEPEVSVP